MSNTGKGDRHERQAKNLLKRLGFNVHKKLDTQYDSSDMFGLFDLIALKPGEKPLFIQVKTNGTGGELGNTLQKARELTDLSHVTLEYWIKYDYEGWRVLRSENGNDWDEIFDGRKTPDNIGETVIENHEL